MARYGLLESISYVVADELHRTSSHRINMLLYLSCTQCTCRVSVYFLASNYGFRFIYLIIIGILQQLPSEEPVSAEEEQENVTETEAEPAVTTPEAHSQPETSTTEAEPKVTSDSEEVNSGLLAFC